MTSTPIRFPEAVTAVTPLGQALDGTRRRKPRPIRQPRRDNIDGADASLTYGCRNPQCDCRTWAPAEYARHMGQEFWWLAQSVVTQWPGSELAQLLTGGVILAELTDDECRAGAAAKQYARNNGLAITVTDALRAGEYHRRLMQGTLTPAEGITRRAPLKTVCSNGHPLEGDNVAILSGHRRCRACARTWSRQSYQRRKQEDPGWWAREQARCKAKRRREIQAEREAQEWRQPRPCDICGQHFDPQSSRSRYCSDPCLAEAQRRRQRDIRKAHREGDHSSCHATRCKARRELDGS